MLTRRDALYGLGASLGGIAFSALLAAEEKRPGPLAPKKSHVPARAKACIFLMMEGGPSHIDTFDPKPKLQDLHLKEFARNDQMQSAMSSGKRYYVASPFQFRKAGQSGVDQLLGSDLRIPFGRQNAGHGVFRGAIGDAVCAQQETVPDFRRDGFGLRPLSSFFGPQVAVENVFVAVGGGFLDGDRPRVQQGLCQRVVLREPLDLAIPQQVGPTVPDIPDKATGG